MITPTVLEGHAVKINDLADHTFVKCPARNQYFNCWGGHDGPEDRVICSGAGLYEVADQYRFPLFGLPDTAGIGMYAVNGVCHQTANLFLYSSGRILNFNVRGYWFSTLLYSVYGTPYPLGGGLAPAFLAAWLLAVYVPAFQRAQQQGIATAPVRAANAPAEDELFQRIQQCHVGLVRNAAGAVPDNHAIAMEENRVLLDFAGATYDAGRMAAFHKALLVERDRILASNASGPTVVNQVNELARRAQLELSTMVSPEVYRKLSGGLEPGQTVGVVNPDLIA